MGRKGKKGRRMGKSDGEKEAKEALNKGKKNMEGAERMGRIENSRKDERMREDEGGE